MDNKRQTDYIGHRMIDGYKTINTVSETATSIISVADKDGGVEERVKGMLEGFRQNHTIISEFGTFVKSVYHEIHTRINSVRERISEEKFGRVLLPLSAPDSYSSISEGQIVAYNLEAFKATEKEHQALDAIRKYLIHGDTEERELTQISVKN